MNTTVNAGDTFAPQKVTNEMRKTEMNAGVTNTRRSDAQGWHCSHTLFFAK